MVIFPKIDFGLCYPRLFQVFLRPSFGACAPPSPNLTFYAYDFLRRVGRLPATFQILSDDLSRHCVPLSPKGKAFLYIPKGKIFLYLYITLIHVLFCSVLFCYTFYGYRYMDIDCAVIYNSLKIFLGEIFHRSFKIT